MEELELTYLAKELPKDLFDSKSKEVMDIYLPTTSNHPVLRLRRNGEEYEMTKKTPIDGDLSRQLEETIPLTVDEYTELATLEGKRVQKTRYYYDYQGVVCEVGVFQGALEGLVLVDVEFATLAEKGAFTMPTFCLADVTDEKFAAGGMLCGKSYADIEHELVRFHYKKLTPKTA